MFLNVEEKNCNISSLKVVFKDISCHKDHYDSMEYSWQGAYS